MKGEEKQARLMFNNLDPHSVQKDG
jgi:hypothetical protein